MALCESRNKENIPPFSSKQTHPFLGITPSSTKTFRRRFRKPLADITNLLNSSPQSASASHSGSHLPPSVSGHFGTWRCIEIPEDKPWKQSASIVL
ncbi:hypothetical protein PVL29_015204 [Vitis rotundifolia]|uniref:Uncharacterized protein n=1 Tax=Vitis rotundifolia TaxID=103349 RepID=A0AA38ZC73_VITRO|nr:hypothetical protein PVL29_015204 [Vitis rotundifolia]